MAPAKKRKLPVKKPTAKKAGARKGSARKSARAAGATRKVAGKKAAAKKAPAKKAAPRKAPAKQGAARPARASPRVGRAGTAGEAEGERAVRAYIEGLRPDQREIAEKVDALIARAVPDVRRTIKWGMPFYGREGRGWFCAFAAFKQHSAVRFLRGTELTPPPLEGTSARMRGVSFREASDIDERQLTAWAKQAAALPGWGK